MLFGCNDYGMHTNFEILSSYTTFVLNHTLFQNQYGNTKASPVLSEGLMEQQCTDVSFKSQIFLLAFFFVIQWNDHDRNVRPQFCPEVSLAQHYSNSF